MDPVTTIEEALLTRRSCRAFLPAPVPRAEIERLLALGARRADIGEGDVPWVVMADPDGNEFCVLRALGDAG